MAAQFVNMYKVELTSGSTVVVSLRQIHYGDIKANRIGAIVLADGQPAQLSGTCSGTAILADGTTVPLTGVVSGNTAYVDLPNACYSVEGQIRVFVKLTAGGVTCTLLAAVGTVTLTETDVVIDPGEIIPSVSALITAIETAVDSIPADYSGLLSAIATTFRNDATYLKGTFAWYNGSLYRFTADHPAGTWNAAHATIVRLADEVNKLELVLRENEDGTYTIVAG